MNYHINCIQRVLDKIWEYSGAVNQLFTVFSKACDLVRGEICDGLIVFGTCIELDKLKCASVRSLLKFLSRDFCLMYYQLTVV